MNKTKKISFGVPRAIVDIPPARDSIDANWNCLQNENLFGHYIKQHQRPHAQARNSIVETFLEYPADYLLFIDTDMMLHPDTALTLFRRMERNPEIGILSAVCFMRNYEDPVPAFFSDNGRVCGNKLFQFYKSHQHISRENGDFYCHPEIGDKECLLEVGSVGAACLLIRREVLEKVKEPWFVFNSDGLGEDMNFCNKAKENGFRIFVDFSVMCGHLIYYPITHNVFLQWAEFQLATKQNGKGKLICEN